MSVLGKEGRTINILSNILKVDIFYSSTIFLWKFCANGQITQQIDIRWEKIDKKFMKIKTIFRNFTVCTYQYKQNCAKLAKCCAITQRWHGAPVTFRNSVSYNIRRFSRGLIAICLMWKWKLILVSDKTPSLINFCLVHFRKIIT